MEFNADLLRKHPYATGAAVLVGGLLVFYLISRGQSSGASSGGTSSGDYASALGASLQMANLNAAAQIQQSQIDAQNHANDLAAQVSNTQTTAQLDAAILAAQTSVAETANNNATQAAMQANQFQYAQNMQSMQDAVLVDNINASVAEQQNSENTQLSALNSQLDYQKYVVGQQVGIAAQGMAYQSQIDNAVLAKAGQSYNTREDADRATAIEQTLLSGGNPSVAASGNQLVATGEGLGTITTMGVVNSVSNAASSLLTAFF